jgi:N-acetylmuramic acid 6-phosphate etherase
LKAGTAQKLVLNALSTAAMVRSGRTWSNLMVGLVPTNGKLRSRVAVALAEATGQDADACAAALEAAGDNGRVALMTLLTGVPTPLAVRALASTRGNVREALGLLATPDG